MKLVDILKNTISAALDGEEVREIGNKLIVVLDNDRRISISFETCGVHEQYAMLLFVTTSKTHGEINRHGVKFKDIIGVGKCVGDDYEGGYQWYNAIAADYKALQNAVSEYVNLWR